MKKSVLLLLVLGLLLVMVGCMEEGKYTDEVRKILTGTTAATTVATTAAAVSTAATTPVTTVPPVTTVATEPTTAATTEPLVPPTQALESDTVTSPDGQVQYVMIYNPSLTESKSTGNFADQLGQAGGQLGADPGKGGTPVSQGQVSGQKELLTGKVELSDFYKTYRPKDEKEFFYRPDGVTPTKGNFQCRYTGAWCNIWTMGDTLSDDVITSWGQEFDTNIYEAVTALYGQPRFSQNGTLINLLCYPMDGEMGGFFTTADSFSSVELTQDQAQQHGCNLDHSIIHLNEAMLADSQKKLFMEQTLVRELQNLIFGSAMVQAQAYAAPWLSEAMGAYGAEKLFAGGAAGFVYDFQASEAIRSGRSLYTLEDTAAFGGAYLFGTYLANLSGEETFARLHTAWREGAATDAQAIAKALTSEVYQKIHGLVGYPASVTLASQEEQILSKLVLDYYLTMLRQGAGCPAAFGSVDPLNLQYVGTEPVQIQAGGRILIAVKDAMYKIPQDAAAGLIYVGLDENLQPITEFIGN